MVQIWGEIFIYRDSKVSQVFKYMITQTYRKRNICLWEYV